ncbi:ABC transporter ATP-binding protein [Paenibacillaceae bacterium WGS1546]|uniref:ABC transporter ATP-binding protein n=1 Tax=Cohnella sp. WGS1546 TaxID=3366810 RepID=UPI00372D1B94
MNPRLKKLISYYKPYSGLLAADLACAVIVSAIALALPLCVRYITTHVLEYDGPDRLLRIYAMGAVMLALVVVHTACNMFISYQGHMMGAKMESDMRSELFEHYQKQSFRFYDDRTTGELMTRSTHDVFSMTELFHHGPEDLVTSVLKFVGAFGILFYIDARLAFIVLLLMPVMTIYALYFNKKMNTALRVSRDRIGDINAQLEDTLSGIRVVQSFANEPIEKRKFERQNERFVLSRKAGYKSETLFYEGLVAFSQLIAIAVVVFGGVAIANATLSLADLLAFILCVGILVEPILRISNFTRLYQEGITGFDRFMEVLEVEPEIRDSADAVEPALVRGQVEFRDVAFKYRDQNESVLNNVSLEIKAGEYAAIVGPSGIGKSTLCALIPRFYDVNEGRILLDGTDVRSIRLRSLRQHIGFVQQDVYLFAGSVADNIRYGKPDADMAEIVEAARKANAHAFIAGLPDGYDTDIGQRGVKLSGGQKQRLSLARVFLKNPPVIIFDEATSALDYESERAVQEAMEKLAENRTMLVVAHRLSTVRNAQRIIVLSDRGVEEQGTHEQLLAREGTYSKLYRMQFGG